MPGPSPEDPGKWKWAMGKRTYWPKWEMGNGNNAFSHCPFPFPFCHYAHFSKIFQIFHFPGSAGADPGVFKKDFALEPLQAEGDISSYVRSLKRNLF